MADSRNSAYRFVILELFFGGDGDKLCGTVYLGLAPWQVAPPGQGRIEPVWEKKDRHFITNMTLFERIQLFSVITLSSCEQMPLTIEVTSTAVGLTF